MDTDLLEKNTVTAKCKLCGFKPIQFECTNCETSCCGSCLDLEKCKKKKHFVGKINDPETISCILHDLELTYFCETCKILICFDCFLEHNAEHQIKMFSHACKSDFYLLLVFLKSSNSIFYFMLYLHLSETQLHALYVLAISCEHVCILSFFRCLSASLLLWVFLFER